MKRRTLLRNTVAMTALHGLSLPGHAAPAERPGVIIIMADDQGMGDLSLTGNPVLRTPNIDRLADEGVFFTDFHSAPEGVSGRSQLLSGTDSLRNRACHDGAGRNVMRRDLPTLAEIFRQDGYTTGIFGKWHLGQHYPDRPVDRGFDRAVWFRGADLASGMELDNDYNAPRYIDNTTEARGDVYCTDLWFREALGWISEQHEKGQPFLTLITPNVAHAPLWPPEAYAHLYQDRTDATTAAYYAMLANLDDNIGRLDSWLQDSGAGDNTIVIYLSDNGSLTGHSQFNAGLRGFKASLYEGGHRVPCLIRWPQGYLDNGARISTPAQMQDILPTLLELCDVPPGNNSFDGTSLAPLLSGGDIAERMLTVQTSSGTRPAYGEAAVIWNNWRLVNGRELYDLDSDPGQQNDVAADYADIRLIMQEHYDAWWQMLEPDLSRPLPAFIGADREFPEMLDSSQWWEIDAVSSEAISQAGGGQRGGVWHIQVFTAGTYTIELRRWPFHTMKSLGSDGPRETVSGRTIRNRSRSIDIAAAVLALDGQEQRTAAASGDLGAVFSVSLKRGKALLQGWFSDSLGRDQCGAFFARIRRIN